MLLFKEKDAVAKKNCQKKSLRFRTFIFHFAWRAKFHAEFLEVVSVRTGNTIFSTFTDFLIFVQFWLFRFN